MDMYGIRNACIKLVIVKLDLFAMCIVHLEFILCAYCNKYQRKVQNGYKAYSSPYKIHENGSHFWSCNREQEMYFLNVLRNFVV